MDQGFIDILKTIIKEQGKEAVIDSAKCKSFLADYTKGEFKKESRFLLQALEAKLPKLIDKEQDIEICFKKSVRIIVEDYGMGEGIAVDLVDTLIHVLKGVPFPKRETAFQKNESKNKQNKEPQKEAAVPKEQYYISLNGTNSGPFELETMKEKIKKGELKRETSVWKEGMKEWAAASAVKELSSFLPPSAPPPAPEVNIPQPKPVPPTSSGSTAQTPKPSVPSGGLSASNNEEKYKEAIEHIKNKRDDQAVSIMKTLAENGFVKAQYFLYQCYWGGYNGVQQNYDKSFEWLHKAAQQGYANAQNTLGTLYYSGILIAKDHVKGVEWYHKAAANGNSSAMLALGNSYRDGNGVQQDYNKAVQWYNKAAENGESAAAQRHLSKLKSEGKI